jgi:ferritin
MPNAETTSTLFDLAIGAEIEAMNLYSRLAKKFSHHSDIANFWHGMLKDELTHAQQLEKTRNSLRPDQLQTIADPSLIQKVKSIHRVPVKDRLDAVETLDDAYELVNDFEHSEVNRVFTSLMSKFVSDEQKKKFALMELQDHLSKLMDFSKSFGDAGWRRNIKIHPKSDQ